VAQHRRTAARCPGNVRLAVAALPAVAASMPWGPLLAGCLAGLAVSVVGRLRASPLDASPAAALLSCRASFGLVVAGLAFLLADPHRPVSACLPAPAWLTSALRVLLAAPAVACTAAIQLGLAAASQRVLQHAREPGLPWLSLAAELAGWCAVALAASAALQRTRWHDIGGVLAVALTLSCLAALSRLPWHPFPVLMGTRAAGAAWTKAGWLWASVCGSGLAVAAWSSRDSWRRLGRPSLRLYRRAASPSAVG
jgi:hypothetical protein